MDFQKIVTEILETGMTQTELAKRCGHGTTQGHISAIYTGRRGDSVGYVLGDALVKIHRKAMRGKNTVSEVRKNLRASRAMRTKLVGSGNGSASDMDVATVVS